MSMCPNCFADIYIPNGHYGSCRACGWTGGDGREKAPHALPVGTVLKNRYILGRLLGAGGFGLTYYACDAGSGGFCAIKEYFPAHIARRGTNGTVLCSDSSREEYDHGCRHFRDEAMLLHTLYGVRAVVRVRDYFAEKQTAYMVMEYLDGMNLLQYVQRMPRPAAQQVVDAFTEICLTLTEVHAKGLLHRDISPQNIILQPDGSLRLIDFGAARYVMGETSKSLSVVLKKGYAPVEQYSSHGHQGPWTDLYSLGATIYYFATGGIRIPEAMDRLDHDTVQPLIQLRPDLPPGFCGLVQNCLMLDWRKRCKSVNEVLGVLMSLQKPAPGRRAPVIRPNGTLHATGMRQRTMWDKMFGYPLVQLYRNDTVAQTLDVQPGRRQGLQAGGQGGFFICDAGAPNCDVVLQHKGHAITLLLKKPLDARMESGAILRVGRTYILEMGTGARINGNRLRIVRES